MRESVLVVGAGLSGAVIARELAERDVDVTVFESRPYVAGNCFTKRDSDTGINVHVHGPHIFHTDSKVAWDYVRRFDVFVPYICRVKATVGGKVYGLPVNLHTINQFFGKAMGPSEAQRFLMGMADQDIAEPRNFEEQALKYVGKDLYEAFFHGYPMKQWGLPPSELPAAVLRRLPVRFSYDDNYFNHQFQGIPRTGYTHVVEGMLAHENIKVVLGRQFIRGDETSYSHVFFSGPLDSWFDYRWGRLGYRTLRFEEIRCEGDLQGCAVMSYPDIGVPFTRITEHKHFAPWEAHTKTIAFREFSGPCGPLDTPYYPIRLAEEKGCLKNYVAAGEREAGVTFVGRLGTYRYLDMDAIVLEAIEAAATFCNTRKAGSEMPAFVVCPL